MEGTVSISVFERDTTCTISPYFKIHEGKELEWKECARQFLELARKETDVVH